MSDINEIKPKVIDNIGYWQYGIVNGVDYYSLGNKEYDTYIKLPKIKLDTIMEVVNLFDGNNSLQAIRQYLIEEKHIDIDVEELYRILLKAGLIEGELKKDINNELSVLGIEILSLNFPKPNKLVKNMAKILLVTWKVIFILALIILFFKGITESSKIKDLFQHIFIVGNSYMIGLLITITFYFLSSFLHELSHWCLAVNYGLKPDKFKMVLYTGFIPLIYVKINGIYTLKKNKRILIMAAGVLTNFLIFLVCLCLLLLFPQTNHINEIIIKVALANIYCVVVNLLPFNITDGYYIFSWILGISNLRINILKTLKSTDRTGMNRYLIIYMLINCFLFVGTFLSTLVWFSNIFKEIFKYVQSDILRLIISLLSIFILVLTVKNFILKVRNYVKD